MSKKYPCEFIYSILLHVKLFCPIRYEIVCGFSATDLEHLSHIGVTNIDVLGDKDDAITTTTTPTPVDSGLVSTTTAATVAAHSPAIPLPDVKVIGTNDPLHGILDPNGLHH